MLQTVNISKDGIAMHMHIHMHKHKWCAQSMRAECELANTFCVSTLAIAVARPRNTAVSTSNICHAVMHHYLASISCFERVCLMEDATVTDSQHAPADAYA